MTSTNLYQTYSHHVYLYSAKTFSDTPTVTVIYYRSFQHADTANRFAAKYNATATTYELASTTVLAMDDLAAKFGKVKYNDQIVFPDRPMIGPYV